MVMLQLRVWIWQSRVCLGTTRIARVRTSVMAIDGSPRRVTVLRMAHVAGLACSVALGLAGRNQEKLHTSSSARDDSSGEEEKEGGRGREGHLVERQGYRSRGGEPSRREFAHTPLAANILFNALLHTRWLCVKWSQGLSTGQRQYHHHDDTPVLATHCSAVRRRGKHYCPSRMPL